MGQLRRNETDETVSQHDQDARTRAFGCPPLSCLTIQPWRDGQDPPSPTARVGCFLLLSALPTAPHHADVSPELDQATQ